MKKVASLLLAVLVCALLVTMPIIAESENASNLLIRYYNGITQYSTDDGSSWSDTPPDGVEFVIAQTTKDTVEDAGRQIGQDIWSFIDSAREGINQRANDLQVIIEDARDGIHIGLTDVYVHIGEILGKVITMTRAEGNTWSFVVSEGVVIEIREDGSVLLKP
ncbi:hypothetical protein FACS1894184_09740 [Clostridia bacterium]|nr:hypothetical protein FACS1894184_09740 [Clostridia bacterium]